MTQLFDFGLVGLGVMGRNFILNVADHHFSAIGLDTDAQKVADLKKEGHSDEIEGTLDKVEFIKKLATPRKIMLLVPAGGPVDHVIDDLLPLLDSGDLIIDGGNSHFEDTNRRFISLRSKGIHFMGAGVSGGSEGARKGPSIMPGGDPKAYELIKPIFEAVAANNLFVIGKNLKKPGIYNDSPDLSNLDKNGDLHYTIDFRSVYATLLDQWLGASHSKVLGNSFNTLNFI